MLPFLPFLPAAEEAARAACRRAAKDVARVWMLFSQESDTGAMASAGAESTKCWNRMAALVFSRKMIADRRRAQKFACRRKKNQGVHGRGT